MRSKAKRPVTLLLVIFLFVGTGLVAGCSSEEAHGRRPAARVTGHPEIQDNGKASEMKARARLIADAWDASKAAGVWGSGYHPLGAGLDLPDDAFHSEADKHAYRTSNFVLHGGLPATPRHNGQVKWENGNALTLSLLGARKAYESLGRSIGGGPPLTVTGAVLDEMTVATSRGRATVPAWLFTLKGYDTPLKVAALTTSSVPEPPVKPAPLRPTSTLAPMERLVGVAGDGKVVTVVADHGSCDDGAAVDVLETKNTVVLSGSMAGTTNGICTADLKFQNVTVKLQLPLGDRVLLDAFTGRPVPTGDWVRPSPR